MSFELVDVAFLVMWRWPVCSGYFRSSALSLLSSTFPKSASMSYAMISDGNGHDQWLFVCSLQGTKATMTYLVTFAFPVAFVIESYLVAGGRALGRVVPTVL